MSRFAYDPVLLPRIVIWTLLLGLLSVSSADPDLWGHVRFGLDILRDGALTPSDPYSFASDKAWINHEWLSELTMGAAFAAAGPRGLIGLKCGLLLVGLVSLRRECARRGVSPLAGDFVVVIAALGCLALSRTIRPQTYSIALFAMLLTALCRAEGGRLRALVMVPPLFVLWANLHGGWLVGLGVLGLWTAIQMIHTGGAARWQWAASGALAVVATLANPYGLGLWAFLWSTVGLDRADISEWQPVTTLPPDVWITWGLFAALTVVTAWRHRPSWARIATLVVIGALSFRVARLVPFFTIAVAVLALPELVRSRRAAKSTATPARGLAAAVILAVFAIGSLGGVAVMAQRNGCIDSNHAWIADRAAVRALQDAGVAGRMVTFFDWGEYAIWHLGPRLRVSIDGRRETVYSERALHDYRTLIAAGAGWDDVLRRLDPDLVWTPPRAPLAAALSTAGWQRAFESERSVVLTPGPLALSLSAGASEPACFPQ